ncbi:shikimate kinase [Caldibacillus thermolactis]|jgi:shikimate kinase|uniref:Shikimate kinase n=1 Tax=Pallidibacillus thermolactis TaxID=251051 RepID=A0ABT2WD58_9BACI|nr:shikimate kinase [Pallidibacillus thermolactis]MCU9593396.1 shikimate kinase [Pallidibacillus thermolactis]MCU9602053.1 shikimate kinase [Pallidibacillus thermolactis subsp. kokeshiiformis]MED1673737.1 shikimate kinase [Pallidibacillus thermolactis subsp. kokeshiiformis]
MSLKEKSIVLTGFMGVGKTSVGKAVAKKLYRDFIDIDEEIEKKFQMPTTKIFKTYGEETFREVEKELVIHFSKQKMKVISLGGGAFLQEEIKQACYKNCIIIFLDLSFESWKDRINLIIDSRPVLQGKSLKEMEKLYYERQPIYSTYHSKIKTDRLDIEETAEYIKDSLKLAWELYE